jgi:hypothetical protein
MQQQRRLLARDEVVAMLQLPNDKIQQLINTNQILVLRITGEERFDSLDLDRLIESYKTTASRRVQ